MKNLLPALALCVLASCSPQKRSHPIAATAHAEVRRAGSTQPQGIVEAGDTVDLVLPMIPIEGRVQVRLGGGKMGYMPAVALALPDSLKAKL
jgi:hypothetical protein